MSHPIYRFAQNLIDEYHLEVTPRVIPPPTVIAGESSYSPSPPDPLDLLESLRPRPRGRVGIIGAGVGGLFAAMLLQKCDIPYEILEASDRIGGRLFTWRFDEAQNDNDDDHAYYDVGAMRFPKTPLMAPVFKLFEIVGVSPHLRPYYFIIKNRNIMNFNGIRRRRDESITTAEDFQIPGIPPAYSSVGWKGLLDNVLDPFRKALVEDFWSGGNDGWRLLMRYDTYSTRGFMTHTKGIEDGTFVDELGLLPYPPNVVNWMETFNTSTTSWDHGLSDAVLESLAFSWPEPALGFDDFDWRFISPAKLESWKAQTSTLEGIRAPLESLELSEYFNTRNCPREQGWACVDGGSEKIAQLMVDYLRTMGGPPIRTRCPVTAIAYDKDQSFMRVTYGRWPGSAPTGEPTGDADPVYLAGGTVELQYAHVIATTTLPSLNVIDLTRAGLSYPQRSSIRQISYGPSTKIGVKFKTAWWNDPKVMGTYASPPLEPMKGGQSTTDKPLRVVVYPSYGPENGDESRSTVLMVSYAWTADAQAWGALMGDDEGSRNMLKHIVLRDLVQVHQFTEDGAAFLAKQWVECKPYSWVRDPHAMGAYAYFGPGQYKTMYRSLTMPGAEGRLFIAGEAASARHAWVLGALEASVRAVYQLVILEYGQDSEEYRRLRDFWPMSEGWTEEKLAKHIALSLDKFAADKA